MPRRKPRDLDCYIVLFHHTEVHKAIYFFAGTHKFKISLGQSTIYLLAFVEIRLLNVFFWQRKTGFGIETVQDAGFS